MIRDWTGSSAAKLIATGRTSFDAQRQYRKHVQSSVCLGFVNVLGERAHQRSVLTARVNVRDPGKKWRASACKRVSRTADHKSTLYWRR